MPSTTFHVPDRLLQEIDQAARVRGQSRNKFVLQACREALARKAGEWPRDFFAPLAEPGDARLLAEAGKELEATVPPVVAEIEYGIQRLEPGSRRRRLLAAERGRLLGAVTVLPWTDESSRVFGACKASSSKTALRLHWATVPR